MKELIRKRKKRFAAFCIMCVMLVYCTMPYIANAATYKVSDAGCDLTNNIQMDPDKSDRVLAGDNIKLYCGSSPYIGYIVNYIDTDGTTLIETLTSTAGNASDTEGDYYALTVPDYSELSGTRAIPYEQFKEWKVTYVYASAGWSAELSLQAVPYEKKNITYAASGLPSGVTMSNSNPAGYYVGKENITLIDADAPGYVFEGWYTDDTFATRVSMISKTESQDINLVAKFTAAPVISRINYHLDGGSNGAGNPSTYTEGTGVASLTDASRTGYTFDGWYSDAALTARVTSISDTQTGDVDLYAKFTAIPNLNPNPAPISNQTPDESDEDDEPETFSITYVLNGGVNDISNPAHYEYGTGVSSLKPAVKAGYTFTGWYSDAGLTRKLSLVSEEQSGNIVLYAGFVTNAEIVQPDADITDAGQDAGLKAPENQNEAAQETAKSPQTADTAPIMMIVLVMASALGMIMVLTGKRA